ncbi:MAG TPA: DUF6230 family protein [Actinokineospora sp.]|nr:DUF6230 family protein [Actinokineospora sp.]
MVDILGAVGAWNAKMRESAADEVRRGTRFGRTVLMGVPATVLVGLLGVGMSEGLLAANFMVVNKPFTIKSDQLEGAGFAALLHDRLVDNGGTGLSKGTARAGFKSAKLDGLCGVVNETIAGLPYTLKITAGEPVNGTPDATAEINASDLVLEATSVNASNSNFADMYLGKSADDVKMGVTPLDGGTPGNFGLEAGTVKIANLDASAYTVELIGSIGLPGLTLTILPGTVTC